MKELKFGLWDFWMLVSYGFLIGLLFVDAVIKQECYAIVFILGMSILNVLYWVWKFWGVKYD